MLASLRANADTALPHVEITIIGGRDRADLVEERVTSWFRGEPVSTARTDTVDARSVLTGEGRAGVQIWVVLTDATVAQVFFTVRERDNGTPRYLVTDVALTSGLDELGIEQVA